MENTLCIVILCIAFFILLGFLCYLIKKEGLRPVVVGLIFSAEKMFKHGENQKKLKWVLNEIIKLIPSPFNLLISSDSIIDFIEEIFEVVKPLMDYKGSPYYEEKKEANNG